MTTLSNKYRGTREYQLVYCKLLSAAQRHDEVLYGEIAEILGIPTNGHHMAREVGEVLGEISQDEHNAGRPMLSAVAVSQKGFPGDGFFVLARTLELLATTESADELKFWMAEEGKVYDTWKPKTVTAERR
jgi:hypothetical protein